MKLNLSRQATTVQAEGTDRTTTLWENETWLGIETNYSDKSYTWRKSAFKTNPELSREFQMIMEKALKGELQ